MIQTVIVQAADVIRIHCHRIDHMCLERMHRYIKPRVSASQHRVQIRSPAMAAIHRRHGHRDAEQKYEIIR